MMKKKFLALILCLAILLTIPITGTLATQTDTATSESQAAEQAAAEAAAKAAEEAAKKAAEEAAKKAAEEAAAKAAAEEAAKKAAEEAAAKAAEEAAKKAAEEAAAQAAAEEAAKKAAEEAAAQAAAEEAAKKAAEEAQQPQTVTETEETQVEETEAPKVEDTEAPKAEETETPKVEESATPEVEESTTPEVEETTTPEVEETTTPEVEETTTPEVEETITPEVTEDPTEAPTEEPAAMTLSALSAGQRYAVADRKDMSFSAEIAGGVAPYAVEFTVNRGGDVVNQQTVTLETAGRVSFSYMPGAHGAHTATITVTDATGAQASGSAQTPVADHSIVERESEWLKSLEDVELTGDWREDLILVAKSQLGYKESDVNFIINDEGETQGYTRYGHWYGSSHAGWCAMFVSFCLNYADIPEASVPREANPGNYKELLQYIGAYEEDEKAYEPKPGDMIFFNWEEKQHPQHIGIVKEVVDGKVYTIEGNMSARVIEREYKLTDDCIVGYGNMETMMIRAGELDIIEETLPIENMTAAINYDGVNLRAEPLVKSESLATLAVGASVTPLNQLVMKSGKVWIEVQLEDGLGYVAAEYVDLAEIPAEEEILPEVTDEPLLEEILPELTDEPLVKVEITTETLTLSSYLAAETDVWQVADGEAWIDVAAGATVTLPSTIESLTANYRCVRRDEAGEAELCATIPMSAEMVSWTQENNVDVSMFIRALNAKSLESMVLEDGQLVYVRTGEALATVHPETGAVTDLQHQIIVAYYNAEDGLLHSIDAE